MKPLTHSQKIDAYRYALDRIKNQGFTYICCQLFSWLDNMGVKIPDGEAEKTIMENFQELYKYRPKNYQDYLGWWKSSDRESRITVLNSLIKELES